MVDFLDEIPAEIYRDVKDLCAEGDQLAAREKYKLAITVYQEAWDLLPNPKFEWNAAAWIQVAIADAAFLNDDFSAARSAMNIADSCPASHGNPFFHLRYGQVLFEAEEHDRAVDELMRAYKIEGEEMFSLDDPKYLMFLKTRSDI